MTHWNCFKIWWSLENWSKFERNVGEGQGGGQSCSRENNLDSYSSLGTGET